MDCRILFSVTRGREEFLLCFRFVKFGVAIVGNDDGVLRLRYDDVRKVLQLLEFHDCACVQWT